MMTRRVKEKSWMQQQQKGMSRKEGGQPQFPTVWTLWTRCIMVLFSFSNIFNIFNFDTCIIVLFQYFQFLYHNINIQDDCGHFKQPTGEKKTVGSPMGPVGSPKGPPVGWPKGPPVGSPMGPPVSPMGPPVGCTFIISFMLNISISRSATHQV